jgi:hypothetical protein
MRREVQLKPEFAHYYPALQPGRWYTAAAITGLVKGNRLVTEGLDLEFAGRILQEDHFEFRGGSARYGNWMGLRTRWQDRHAAVVGHRHPALA